MPPLNPLVMRLQGIPRRALTKRYQLRRHLLTPSISFCSAEPDYDSFDYNQSNPATKTSNDQSSCLFLKLRPLKSNLRNSPRIHNLNVSYRLPLDAKLSTNGGSNYIGMMPHQWFRLSLDHDSR
jgi:hypothetical protein